MKTCVIEEPALKDIAKTSFLLLSITLTCLVAVSGQSMTFDGVSTDTGIVAEYRMDAGGGDTAYSSKNSNHAILNGAGWTTGVEDGGIKFGGPDDYLRTDQNANIPQQYTLSTWVKGDFDEQSTDNIYVFGWESKIGLALSSGSDGSPRGGILIRDSADSTYHSVWSGTNTLDGEWHHIAATVDRDTMEVDVYIDGELDTSETIPDHYSGSRNMIIGAWGTNYGHLNGKMDNARFYSTVLNSSQIKGLYNSGALKINSKPDRDASKVLDMDFQTLQNGQILDRSGYDNHGTPENGPSQLNAVNCRIGRCFRFDGSDDRVVVENDSSLNFGSDGRFTVTMWTRVDNYDPDNLPNYRHFITKASGEVYHSGDGPGWGIYWDTGSDEISFSTRDSSTNGGSTFSGVSPNDNRWHFIAARSDGSQIEINVDGKWRDTGNINYDDATSEDLHIHGDGRYLDADTDQVKIFNRTLNDREVWKLYTRGRDRSSENSVSSPAAHYGFDAGPAVCIYDGAYSGGGWGAPSSTALNNLLESEGWNTKLVTVGDLTEDGWRKCDVIVNPDGEHIPITDKSADFCESVNVEGSEHDVFAEMQEFMDNGGLWIGSWGAGIWYVHAWDGSGWQDYPNSCSQYSGDATYGDSGGSRCSDLGYSCYSGGNYAYTNVNQSVLPSLDGTITGVTNSDRWASGLDINVLQAYDGGSPVSGKYAGMKSWGDGWYFHMGDNYLYNPSSHDNASRAWNNLLTWYAGNGDQRTWDSAGGDQGAISGDENDPVYSKGKIGGAMEFDGTGDGTKVDQTSMDLTGSISICLWMKPDDMAAQRENPIDKAYGGEFSFTLEDSSNGVLSTYFGSAGSNSGPYATNRWNEVASNGEWSHICWTRDNSAQEVKLYKNGKDWSSKRMSTNWEPPSSSPDPLTIGNGYTTSFDGKIDDVRIYPYALSHEEVRDVYTNGGGSFIG